MKNGTIMVTATSSGENDKDYALITVDGRDVEMMPNENGHYRGLHIAIINPYTGKVEVARVFDTYKSS